MLTTKAFATALSMLALPSCAESSKTADSTHADPARQSIDAPDLRDIFRDINGDGVVGDPIQVGEAGGMPIFETRYLFDEERLLALCLLPDADSFDDYEVVDPMTGHVVIPRGTTPLSTRCPADGIVTGPLHEQLIPSSWCRIEGCGPDDAGAGG